VNAEFLCGLVEQTFVAEELQLVPRGHSDSILRCQHISMPRYQCYGVIIGGKKYPVFEAVFSTEIEKQVNLPAVVCSRPRYVAANVPGSRGHEMSTLPQDPHRNASTAQTSHYSKASIIRGHHQRTNIAVVLCDSNGRGSYRWRNCSCF
jgi:hypothetical protein